MSDASINTRIHEGEASFGDYFALLKPRVMSLVVFTALVGLLVAPNPVHPFVAFASILFIAVGGGASGALNMWWDADIDRKMKRTQKRPIPSGKVEESEALAIGVTLSAFAVVMLALAANVFAGLLLAFTIFFYVVIYTMWLKRSTPQNIVIGGAAGAFPPMIGWAVATGGVSIESVLMFMITFMWTPPHFWALALYKCDDYEKAGVPMLPVVSGVLETKRQMLLYTVLLLPVSLLPWWIGTASAAWGALATVFGLIFIGFAVKVWFDTTDRSPRQMFRFSLLYLSVLFAGLIVDNLVARFAGPTFGV